MHAVTWRWLALSTMGFTIPSCPGACNGSSSPDRVQLDMPSWTWVEAAVTTDIDADGDLDILLSHHWTFLGNSPREQFAARNDGARTWRVVELETLSGQAIFPSATAAGDVNGDGRGDVCITTWDGHRLLLGSEHGLRDVSELIPESARERTSPAVAVADLTGDGRDEVVLAGTEGWQVLSWEGQQLVSIDSRTIWLGLSDFGGAGWPMKSRVMDWEDDGDLDVVVFGITPLSIRLLTNDGSGRLTGTTLLDHDDLVMDAYELKLLSREEPASALLVLGSAWTLAVLPDGPEPRSGELALLRAGSFTGEPPALDPHGTIVRTLPGDDQQPVFAMWDGQKAFREVGPRLAADGPLDSNAVLLIADLDADGLQDAVGISRDGDIDIRYGLPSVPATEADPTGRDQH